jgi:hypothetical protein
MKKTILLFPVLLFFLFSCKKESHNQFSHWYVGNDSFASNNVIVQSPPDPHNLPVWPPSVQLECLDANNNFILGFWLDDLPKGGTLFINNLDTVFYNPSVVDIYVHYHSAYYIVSNFSHSYLSASSSAGTGKASYIMPPTWFVSYSNHNDSILVHGVFNEP